MICVACIKNIHRWELDFSTGVHGYHFTLSSYTTLKSEDHSSPNFTRTPQDLNVPADLGHYHHETMFLKIERSFPRLVAYCQLATLIANPVPYQLSRLPHCLSIVILLGCRPPYQSAFHAASLLVWCGLHSLMAWSKTLTFCSVLFPVLSSCYDQERGVIFTIVWLILLLVAWYSPFEYNVPCIHQKHSPPNRRLNPKQARTAEKFPAELVWVLVLGRQRAENRELEQSGQIAVIL
jgi:hypothetical protein